MQQQGRSARMSSLEAFWCLSWPSRILSFRKSVFFWQAFAYYGYSVSGIDVNGDGNDDLLVGAPFYRQTEGDEGIVYVYSNNGMVIHC